MFPPRRKAEEWLGQRSIHQWFVWAQHLPSGRQCARGSSNAYQFSFSLPQKLSSRASPVLSRCLDTLLSLPLSYASTHMCMHTESLHPALPLSKDSSSVPVYLEEPCSMRLGFPAAVYTVLPSSAFTNFCHLSLLFKWLIICCELLPKLLHTLCHSNWIVISGKSKTLPCISLYLPSL